MYAVLAVATGGALGSVARYLVSTWFAQTFGPGFPWGTLAINVTGSFAIGVILQFAAASPGFGPQLRLFAATGFLGGYTTFSTFAYETLLLGESARFWNALGYIAASVVAGLAAAWLGVVTARALTAG
ncbi:MAG TPA: fluoride efflux transporter CrcB [Candidatus Baltobacteraceae bacterium]|nr:fluoride efflux transporter CrcB [Candidatus Baltobacteraceae bacterium]